MATLSINTQHAHHGPRQPWSPVASSPLIIPSSTSPESSLSARCRALAHRLGHEAVQDDAFSHSDDPEPTTPSSPRRLSPSGQGSPRFSPLVSPRSGHRDLHPPPTPEGSFVLETLQEESETPRAETAQLDFGTASSDVAPSSSSLSLGGEGAYGASAPADDEMSSSTSWSGRFGFAAALAAGGSASQGDDIHEKQELARASLSLSASPVSSKLTLTIVLYRGYHRRRSAGAASSDEGGNDLARRRHLAVGWRTPRTSLPSSIVTSSC